MQLTVLGFHFKLYEELGVHLFIGQSLVEGKATPYYRFERKKYLGLIENTEWISVNYCSSKDRLSEEKLASCSVCEVFAL